MILMDRLRQQTGGGGGGGQRRSTAASAPAGAAPAASNPFNIDFSRIQIPQNLLQGWNYLQFLDLFGKVAWRVSKYFNINYSSIFGPWGL